MENLEFTIGILLKSQYFAVLNSVGNDTPYGSLVSFAATPDLRTLLFVTGRNTRKYNNMMENKLVSVLIDNRTNQPSDISRAIAITAIGEVREIAEKESDFLGLFISRHPDLGDFVRTESNALMRIDVREYMVSTFSDSRRFTFGV